MAEAPAQLRKILGRRQVLAIAFGAMVGWGWVVLSGEMIDRAGTIGSAAAFVVGAIMVLLVGLTYAELTPALSRAGGELGFAFAGIGPRAAFVCGWTLILAYLSVCAFEAVALPTVLGYLFPGWEGPHLYTIAGWEVRLNWVLIGVGGALAIGLTNYFGVTLASAVQTSATIALLLVGLAFFIPGNVTGELARLEPYFTDLGGFFGVVIMTPFLFLGFDVIPQVAEEVKIPALTIGRLILISILVAVVWYVLVQWTVGLTLDDAALAASELATADAMTEVYGSAWGGRVLVFGGLLGILTSWNAFFIGASRVMFAMSRGGMLPGLFSRLHPQHGSPVFVVALLTAVTAIAPFFGRRALVWLVDAGGLAAVLAYFFVTVSFLRLRRTHPDLPRPYRAPAPFVTGSLAVLATLFFIGLYMPGSPSALVWPAEWLIVLSWAALGLLFAVVNRRRAVQLGYDEQARRILGQYAGAFVRSPEAEPVATET